MKKYITTVSFAKITLFVFMLFTTLVSAAEGDPTDLPDAPVDAPTAPIDDYVWVLALIGLVYVYFRIRAFTKQVNSESK